MARSDWRADYFHEPIQSRTDGEFSINHQSIGNLTAEERETILGYELVIYICEGTEREKLDWFDVVNTAGEKLTTQERRNAIYAGPWLNEAKKYFSKTGCPAVQRAEKYMNGSAIRQQILETVLGWIADRDGGDIEDYMSAHQHDKGCEDLWSYFDAVVRWTEETFINARVKLMKGLPWGVYYNRYGQTKYDANAIESKIAKLLRDDEDIGDITNQRGIYEYVLDGDERHLSIRKFSDKMARTAYERRPKIRDRGNGGRPHQAVVEGRQNRRRKLPDALCRLQQAKGWKIAGVTSCGRDAKYQVVGISQSESAPLISTGTT